MNRPRKHFVPLVFVLAGAVALSQVDPQPARAGSGGAIAAGAAGFVMGVIVGRATTNKRVTVTNRSSGSSRSGSSTRYVRDDATIQQALNAFGHDAGKPDGVFGPRTRDAIRKYQGSLGEPATGDLTSQQRARLLADYASLVNRNNNNNNNTNTDGGGSGSGSGGTQTQTASANDFLQRLRQQNPDAKGSHATGGVDGQTADQQARQDGTVQVAFDELCSRFEQQATESRVIDVSLKTAQQTSGSLVLEQLCTARSYALQNLEADLAALGNLDIASAGEECRSFTATQVESLGSVGKDEPASTVASFEQLFGDVGDQREAVVQSTRVCLGLAYAFDDPEGAVVTAASLTALGETGYGEIVGEHLAMGIGLEANPARAADWMEWTAAEIDEGAKPVVDVAGYDRAPLLRVLAEVVTDTGKETGDTRSASKGGLKLPGMKSSREDDAVAFFAAESVAMIKSLETLMLAVGLDRPALKAACSAGQDIDEALSMRVCRAFAYATRDFESMYRYDQLLAEANDEDAKTRLGLYDALGEQGMAKLAATSN